MPKFAFAMIAALLVACSQPPAAPARPSVSMSSTDSIRAEMQERFGAAPDTLDIRPGARIRVVYVDTSGRDLAARTPKAAYSEDSLQYDRGFDRAVWLWSRTARPERVDTISVRYHVRGRDRSPLVDTELFFYAKQLENPADRPHLDREARGPSRSDTLPTRLAPGRK